METYTDMGGEMLFEGMDFSILIEQYGVVKPFGKEVKEVPPLLPT